MVLYLSIKYVLIVVMAIQNYILVSRKVSIKNLPSNLVLSQNLFFTRGVVLSESLYHAKLSAIITAGFIW